MPPTAETNLAGPGISVNNNNLTQRFGGVPEVIEAEIVDLKLRQAPAVNLLEIHIQAEEPPVCRGHLLGSCISNERPHGVRDSYINSQSR